MSSTFSQFPEFTPMTQEDREEYNEFAKKFPPCGALSFGTLVTWWSTLEPAKVARYGDNLIISIWYPGYDEYSGLSVLGGREIDETICAVFDFQRERGQELRIFHVPEFVVSKIRYPEMLRFESERDHDECIVNVKSLSDPAMLPEHKRWKLLRFLSEFNEDRIQVRPLDLTSVYDRDCMLEKIDEWRSKGGLNDFAKHDEDCLRLAINKGPHYGYGALGLFIDGQLEAYLVTSECYSDGYARVSYARFSFSPPYFMEIAVYSFAKWFQANAIKEVNIESDSGFPVLRQIKLSMGPSNFLRMYTISVAESKPHKL